MNNIDKEYFEDDLKTTRWLGEVVDVNDNTYTGKIKVKVYGKFDDLSTDDIPWAYPYNNVLGGDASGGGFYAVPKKGSVVNIIFDNGNIYHPMYFSNYRVHDSLKSEIESNQENFYSLLYDTDEKIKITYDKKNGLMLNFNESKINIRPDNSIYIDSTGRVFHVTKNGISLGQEDASNEPAVLGDKNVDALTEIHDRINDICTYINSYAAAQASVVGSVVILAPLAAALAKLAADNAIVTAQLPILANMTIPATKSKKVTLD